MRDIVLAGAMHTDSFLEAPPMERLRGTTGGLAVTLSAPDVLIGEVEVVPSPEDVKRPPRLPSPLVTSGGGG